ncbi:MAG: hypothetical protein ACQETH_13645 [Candidatus Rifleibacteriota bacterium]
MNNDELFPFPGSTANDEDDSLTITPDLPDFPEPATQQKQQQEATELTADEIKQLRKIIKHFADSGLLKENKEAPAPTPIESRSSAAPTTEQLEQQPPTVDYKQLLLNEITGIEAEDDAAKRARDSFANILEKIKDPKTLLQVFRSISGVFPIGNSLRHGTPEQKLFALTVLGDRFLQEMAGQHFSQRKDLLKTVSLYLTACSKQYKFIQMENDNFSPQFHERVAGSGTGNRIIREMRGFLIVAQDSNQIVRIGQVLT